MGAEPGRFAGEIIDPEDVTPTAPAHAGREITVEEIAELDTHISEAKQAAVKVPPNTRARPVSRAKKDAPERTMPAAPEAPQQPAPTFRLFEDPEVPPVLTEKTKTVIAAPPEQEPVILDGPLRPVQEFFYQLGSLTKAVIIIAVATLVLGGYILAALGPWMATDSGVIKRGMDLPLNALPAGTAVTIARLGDVAPTGTGRLIPFVMGTSTAEIVSPVGKPNGDVVGYTVKCTGGECDPGIVVDVSMDSILGPAPGSN